jgi:hypothetical protein
MRKCGSRGELRPCPGREAEVAAMLTWDGMWRKWNGLEQNPENTGLTP